MKNRFSVVSFFDPEKIFLPPGPDTGSAFDYCLEPLKSNIKKNGIITPLIVRRDENGNIGVICGRRRLICARLLRMKSVPCIKIKCTKQKAALIRLSERISAQRCDYFEVSEGIADLINNHSFTLSAAASGLGIPLCEAEECLKLTSFPYELRQTALDNISREQALCLLALPKSDIPQALDDVIKNNLSMKGTREYVSKFFLPQKKEPVRKAAIGDIKLFSNSIEKLLYTLSGAGYETDFSISNEKLYIDYNIKIKKKDDMLQFSQMKIC